MAILNMNRSRLLLGCGPMALAISLTLTPENARAQAINASETYVVGMGERLFTGSTTETVGLDEQVTVIDWTPIEDGMGNALDFLPDGNTVTFENGNFADFSVLNRILPDTNGNVAVINGSVVSQFNLTTPVTGGTVAFYSPTGILVGSTAAFDVGSLILTANEPDLATFQDFALNGGPLQLGNFSSTGNTTSVTVQSGAQINATNEGSFFITAAPQVNMNGTSRVNGSQAYIGADFVNVTISNGLFDIQVVVGTEVPDAVLIDGNVGGPASTGVGDNHIIYAVAKAVNDPISMIFSGNLGFDPAVSAGVVNGEIILSANYDVQGRTVQDGSISDGIAAVFTRPDDEFDPPSPGLIDLQNFTATSSLLAISNDTVTASAFSGNSSVEGDLLLVGRIQAQLIAAEFANFDVTGDVLVSARNFGVQSSSLQDPTVIDASSGTASIDAFLGSNVIINGSALVTADAFGGVEDIDGFVGAATGGVASVFSESSAVDIAGSLDVSASAFGVDSFSISEGAEIRAGVAEVVAEQGGTVTVISDLSLAADATGPTGGSTFDLTASDVFGGLVTIGIGDTGGAISAGDVDISADATATFSSNTQGGGSATGGDVLISTLGGGTIQTNSATVTALANGGADDQGVGGAATGGIARVVSDGGGDVVLGGDIGIDVRGIGGSGLGGGTGSGGLAALVAEAGLIQIAGGASLRADARGGAASFGEGGAGGDGFGGAAQINSNGTPGQASDISILGDITLLVTGTGGIGGNGSSIVAGGDGGRGVGGNFTDANAIDPAEFNGAQIFADSATGSLTIGGTSNVLAVGRGGDGGINELGGSGGNGGDGEGGTARAELRGTDPAGVNTASFGLVFLNANGDGGNAGTDGVSLTNFLGDGGAGSGGNARFSSAVGQVLSSDVLAAQANGEGGDGINGGAATGGAASLQGSLGGAFDVAALDLSATARGGSGTDGLAGEGFGGLASIFADNTSLLVRGNASLDSSGFGGNSDSGVGGSSTGGNASFEASGSTINFTANASGERSLQINASSFAGTGGAQGGSADGGNATFDIQLSSLTGGSIELASNATAGNAGPAADGGAAQSGVIQFSADSSTLDLVGNNVIQSNAQGGSGQNGGVSMSAGLTVAFTNTDVTIAADGSTPGSLSIEGEARGGDGDVLTGDVEGGDTQLVLSDSSFVADSVFVSGIADGSNGTTGGAGGNAFAGVSGILVEGNSVLDAGSVVITADAISSAGGSTTAGEAGLATGGIGDEFITIGTLVIDANGVGGSIAGTPDNTAGAFFVDAQSGEIVINSLEAAAVGDFASLEFDTSTIAAIGGNVIVNDSALLNAIGAIDLITGVAGVIGGDGLSTPIANIAITSGSVVTITGDDDAVAGVNADRFTVASMDIAIEPGARIASRLVDFSSGNTTIASQIGGTAAVAVGGYTLTEDELNRISGADFTFTGPAIANKTDPNDPDILLLDAQLDSSQNGGFASLNVIGDSAVGIIRVEGSVGIASSLGDEITLFAGERIEVVTPGGLFVTNDLGQVAGAIRLNADNIWVADAATIAQLQADPGFAGRNDQLAVAAAGSADPGGYIQGDLLDISVAETLLVRNTGTASEQGGLTIGDGDEGGLLLISRREGAPNTTDEIDVFAYGRQELDNGSIITGEDFFRELVVFDNAVGNPAPTLYTNESELNDCNINTGGCNNAAPPPTTPTPAPPPPPTFGGDETGTPAAINNPEVVKPPVEIIQTAPQPKKQVDAEFGVDFPGLVEAPLLSEDPLLEDPVASGGDSSLYSRDETEAGGDTSADASGASQGGKGQSHQIGSGE